MKIITREFLQEGRSPAGGWNKKQIELLRLKWPVCRGWQSSVIGKTISLATAERFIELRGTAEKQVPEKRKVKSDLPFAVECPEDAKRTVNSFWVWLSRQPAETRAGINDAITYLARKNHQSIQ
jgi:hypothetical protein